MARTSVDCDVSGTFEGSLERQVRSMAWQTIADLLHGVVPPGTTVTVKGWVRTRRDSKAGLSFIHVHDGSCFAPIQVVAASDAAQLRRARSCDLTTGCAVDGRRATLVAVRRARARRSSSRRTRCAWSAGSTIPDTYPIPPKRHTYRVPARGRAPAARAPTPSARSRACATLPGPGHPPLLPRARLLLDPHADHHGQRCRGRRASCSASPRSIWRTSRARRDGQVDFAQDFFGRQAFLTVSGQLNVETYCLALTQRLHLRPDLPRRELQHQPPPGRVLDDRAGDRLRRSRRRRRPGRGLPASTSSAPCSNERAGRHGVLRRARRQDVRARASKTFVDSQLRAHDLHRGDRGPGEVGQDVRVPGPVGHRPAVASTSAT